MSGSDHPNHTVLARGLQDYLTWRNANARHPDVLAAQRRFPSPVKVWVNGHEWANRQTIKAGPYRRRKTAGGSPP